MRTATLGFALLLNACASAAAYRAPEVKRVDVAHALEEEARAQYEQTVLGALEEVETALVGYRTSLGRVDRIGEAAAGSGRAAELARLRFSGGVTDFLQVLDAERTQLEAEDQLARGRTDASIAYAALYKALGGGNEAR